jgi:hypothetical protein
MISAEGMGNSHFEMPPPIVPNVAPPQRYEVLLIIRVVKPTNTKKDHDYQIMAPQGLLDRLIHAQHSVPPSLYLVLLIHNKQTLFSFINS